MSTEAWHPDATDKVLGIEAYIRYASGVAILNDPEKMAPVHGHEVAADTASHIYAIAENLMINGLTEIIRYANPSHLRRRLDALENRFDQAFPHLFETVNAAHDTGKDRLYALNPFFAVVRPAPILNKVVYRHICHRRMSFLTGHKLMDGIHPSPVFINSPTKTQ